MKRTLGFAEGALLRSVDYKCSVSMRERISKTVTRVNRAALLYEYDAAGQSRQGANVCPPLVLLKGVLLKLWFRMPLDPGLENQISNRIPSTRFSCHRFNSQSSDDFPFSRFRNGFSKEGMVEINHAPLLQCARKTLGIDEGMATDARFFISIGRAVNKEKRAATEGKHDRDAEFLKCSRDRGSDRTRLRLVV